MIKFIMWRQLMKNDNSNNSKNINENVGTQKKKKLAYSIKKYNILSMQDTILKNDQNDSQYETFVYAQNCGHAYCRGVTKGG